MCPPSFIKGLSFHLRKCIESLSNLEANALKYLQDKFHGEERETLKKPHYGFQYKQYETLQYTMGPFLELRTSKTFETSHIMKTLDQCSVLHKFEAEV